MTCRCLALDTPNSIMEQGNDHYPEDTDIFGIMFNNAPFVNAELMQMALWARYRYRMIGSCNTPEWIRAMKDRLYLIGGKWDDILTKSIEEDMTDLHEVYYTRIIQRKAIDGTDGDVRTDTGSGEDVSVVEDEDMPQTPIGDERYLSRRSTSKVTPTATRTSKFTPNNQDSETYTEDRNILAKTFSEMVTAYPDLLSRFADEFQDYFVPVIG